MSGSIPASPASAQPDPPSRGMSIRWVAIFVVTLPLVALGASLDQFRGAAARTDDVTFVVARIR